MVWGVVGIKYGRRKFFGWEGVGAYSQVNLVVSECLGLEDGRQLKQSFQTIPELFSLNLGQENTSVM